MCVCVYVLVDRVSINTSVCIWNVSVSNVFMYCICALLEDEKTIGQFCIYAKKLDVRVFAFLFLNFHVCKRLSSDKLSFTCFFSSSYLGLKNSVVVLICYRQLVWIQRKSYIRLTRSSSPSDIDSRMKIRSWHFKLACFDGNWNGR